MKLITLIALVPIGAGVQLARASTSPTPVEVLTVSDTNDGDSVAAADAVDLGVNVATSKKCTAKWRTYTDTVTYLNDAGKVFDFTHAVTFEYNCVNVLVVNQSKSVTVYQPEYVFLGYAKSIVSHTPAPTATSDVQARFGICVDNNVCLDEHDPETVWHMFANGKAYVTHPEPA